MIVAFLCSLAFIAFIDKLVCKNDEGKGSEDGDAEENENPIADN